MTIEEFENQIRVLTTQFQEKQNWVEESKKITHFKETKISEELIKIMQKPGALKLLLNEFAKVKGCESLNDVANYENIKVEQENEYIDIKITLDDEEKSTIFIENKIHAVDQPNQLWRYSRKKPKRLFYLTRFGHKASVISETPTPEEFLSSALEEGKDYFCISYYEHIYNWLCRLKEENKEKDDDVNKLLVWVLESFVNSPELFEHILENKEYVKFLFRDDIKNDPNYNESRYIIQHGCGKNENNSNQGFIRFNNFIVWTKLFPRLEKFADENGLKLIISDRFEFKRIYHYFILQSLDDSNKTIKFRLDNKRTPDDTWEGVSVDGELMKHHRWDFWTLLDYESEDGLLNEIIEKVSQRFSLNI